jgi:hypothetical protein
LNRQALIEAARQGYLYPAVILHGAGGETRRQAAVELGRTLLCEAPPAERPCGVCRHCRRIVWPGAGASGPLAAEAPFHPDFQVLERDLKTSTSVEAARELMRLAQVSPFEARGQVFVIASAESLTGEAANALLKSLEEPHVTAPRHFLLLAPSRLDLLPTLRSRSLAVFLGPESPVDAERVDSLARAFGAAADAWTEGRAAIHLLAAAEALAGAGAPGADRGPAGGRAAAGSRGTRGSGTASGSGTAGGDAATWDDPRASRPWALAAAAVLRSLEAAPDGPEPPTGPRRAARLALAEALLTGPLMRLRGISPERILEGLVSRHLAAVP